MVNLKTLNTKSLILDMTTNLSRIGNFVLENDYKKAKYFALETEKYIEELETREYDNRFMPWIKSVKNVINNVKERSIEAKYIADDSFTCGIVLQNKAIYLLS